MSRQPFQLLAQSSLVTEHGPFTIFGFSGGPGSVEIPVLMMGDIGKLERPLVVVHSECLNGDIFHSLECDCYVQLNRALASIAEAQNGLLIYMRGHEGRGHGLINKLHIYELMKLGLDTVDACHFLGIPVDIRDYQPAVDILHHFGITRLRLATNNPGKIKVFRDAGFDVEPVPLPPEPNERNLDYLLTKQARLGHTLGLEATGSATNRVQSGDLPLEAYFPAGIAAEARVIPLRSLSNKVYLVSTSDRLSVLKHYHHRNEEKVLVTQALRRALQGRGIRIPALVPNRDGDSLTCGEHGVFEMSEFIAHVPISYPAVNITPEQLEKAAALLAQIHATPLSDLPPGLTSNFIGLPDGRVQALLSEFDRRVPDLLAAASPDEAKRLALLVSFIEVTTERRRVFEQRGTLAFQSQPVALNHGDFSLTNLLPTVDGQLYLTDWDNSELRPRVWELQRALLLICGRGNTNAHLAQLNLDRAEAFLAAYHAVLPLTPQEIAMLPEIQEFIFLCYWLHFTLASVLRGDYRILHHLPSTLDEMMGWNDQLEPYGDWLAETFQRIDHRRSFCRNGSVL